MITKNLNFKEHFYEMAPQLIPDVDFIDDPKNNKRFTYDFLKKCNESNIIKKFDEHTFLYKAGSQIALIDLINKETGYVVIYKVKKSNLLKLNAIQQVAVWRADPPPPHVTGLAKHIFFNELLPKYGLMITDHRQTKEGRRFWGNRIADALSLGLKIYCVDLIHNAKYFKEINNLREYKELLPELYGREPKYKSKRSVIANREISNPFE